MAEWIWKDTVKPNEYVEFLAEFDVKQNKNVIVQISAHSNYALYINGQVALFSQYADYPFYKVYDSLDISKFVKIGKNIVAALCFYMGADVATNYNMQPGLWYNILQDGNVLACSNSDTLCRESLEYKGLDEFITPQLGYNYFRDMTLADNWKNGQGDNFEKSVQYPLQYSLKERPIKILQMQEPICSTVIERGIFELNGGETSAQKMYRAKLSNVSSENMKLNGAVLTMLTASGDGCYFLVDVGKESAGYINCEIDVAEDCLFMLGFGEHIKDGRVRTEIESRNFAYTYKLKKGKNIIKEELRRTGARYLAAMVFASKCSIKQITICEATYPITEIPVKLDDELMQKIYDTGVSTLRICMHEHYEDCPWREQALYAMDSRNQILYGYYVFNEFDFAKASLRLMGLSIDEDGLLGLCAPAKCGITIPSFSLYWVMAMCEYVEHTSDRLFFEEMMPQLKSVLNVFLKRVTTSGLKTFGGKRYWNFHEWSDGLDGGMIFREQDIIEVNDAILTFLAAHVFKKVYSLTQIAEYGQAAKTLKDSSKLFCCSDGFYCSYIGEDGAKLGRHMFTQAMAIYCGCAKNSEVLAEKLIKTDALVPNTFAGLPFLYDALIGCGNKYLKYVLKNIEETFSVMLDAGATSFWETAKGDADFNNAGSLCHGWSSVPCYIYNKYLKR